MLQNRQIADGHRWIDLAIPAVLCPLAFLLRTLPAIPNVFLEQGVRFNGVDAWYHMRRIDVLTRNFPHSPGTDPYGLYPGGQPAEVAPLFDLLVGAFIYMFGGSEPSQSTVDLIAAVMPPILGAMVAVLVYFIGTQLLDRWSGFVAGLLAAVMPSEFFIRSALAFTDHHVAEVLFSTLALYCIVRGLRSNATRDESDRIFSRTVALPVLAAGVSLGLYLATWTHGFFFIAVLMSWLGVQFLVDQWLGRSSRRMLVLMFTALVSAALVALPVSGLIVTWKLQGISLLASAAAICALFVLDRFLQSRVHKRAILLASAFSLLSALILVGLAMPGLVDALKMMVSSQGMTIIELKPLFAREDWWSQYNVVWLIAIPSVLLMLVNGVLKDRPDRLLIAIAGLVVFAASVVNSRFSYYLAIEMALFGGFLVGGLASLLLSHGGCWFRRIPGIGVWSPPVSLTNAALGVAVSALVLIPNLSRSLDVAATPGALDTAWFEALVWMREGTPRPFAGDDDYFRVFDAEKSELPEPTYSVLAWWDYGNWITRIARRVPVSNPIWQQGAGRVARFFTSAPGEAALVLDGVKGRYVFVDSTMPVWLGYESGSQGQQTFSSSPGAAVNLSGTDAMVRTIGKYDAMLLWSGRAGNKQYGIYYKRSGGGLVPVILYYPAYYQAMMSRLYVFDGKASTRTETWVVHFRTEGSGGRARRIISDLVRFDSYREARDYVGRVRDPNSQIVGTDPTVSCIPLDALDQFEKVYESVERPLRSGATSLAAVKIFEFRRDAEKP